MLYRLGGCTLRKDIREIEAKYAGIVSPQDIVRVLGEDGYQVYSSQFVQEDHYYDSADLVLAGSDLSLRTRSISGSRKEILTFKRILYEPVFGIYAREEINTDIDLDIISILNTPSQLPPLKRLREFVREHLLPSLFVRNDRTTITVEIKGILFEISVDTVEFSMRGKTACDNEIEIEQKGENREVMDELIGLLDPLLARLSPQTKDKYRRGLDLLGNIPTRLSLSYSMPLQTVAESEIHELIDMVPVSYVSLFEQLIGMIKDRLSRLAQLSLLYNPRDISSALIVENEIQRLAKVDPFLQERTTEPTGWFISVTPPAGQFQWFTHTRFQHSLDTAKLAMSLAASTQISEYGLVLAGLAGLIHDQGHPALCHSGEVIVIKHGGTSHEQRTREFVRAISQRLTNYDISPDDLREILEEKGWGEILNLADTLSYLERDGNECGKPLPPGIAQTILENFRFKDGKIVFNTELISGTQAMLDFRCLMYNSLYFHPYSRIEEAMQQKALVEAIAQGAIDVEDLVNGDDPTLLAQLAQFGATNPEINPLVAGFFPDYCSVHHYRPIRCFDPVIAEKDIVNFIESKLGLNSLDYVICPPFAGAGSKKIKGVDEKGNPILLRAKQSGPYHSYENSLLVAISPKITVQEILDRLFIP